MKDPRSAEVTPQDVYQRRRDFLKNAGFFLATAGATAGGFLALSTPGKPRGARPVSAVQAGDAGPMPELTVARRGEYTVEETVTSYDSITTYNNYYELGTGKGDPAASGGKLRVRPWTVEVGGLVHRPQVVDVDELVSTVPLEERVYRMRCVEAWSMVIPWLGFPLRALLDRVEPLGSARYVAFETLYDPEQLPGQSWPVLPWPYVEGLRLDEALHPLTLLAVGLYGQRLLPQNGAPLRLVVPWKYGFKGIKSIVRMTLVEDEPVTTWSRAAPSEYGFYANVNPQVPHPRWSQASERRLGELLRRPTLPFNGYAEQVAGLYSGMDLTRSF